MPNYDRVCTSCGFTGSYLDFRPTSATDPKDQRCVQAPADGCGKTVRWRDDEEDD